MSDEVRLSGNYCWACCDGEVGRSTSGTRNKLLAELGITRIQGRNGLVCACGRGEVGI